MAIAHRSHSDGKLPMNFGRKYLKRATAIGHPAKYSLPVHS